MSILITVTGLTGSGKTTAVTTLAKACGGQVVYLGEMVLDKVREMKLPETVDNQNLVRLQLREQNGPAALAQFRADHIAQLLKGSAPVLIDAIYNFEEFEFLKTLAGSEPAYLLALHASDEIRRLRLAQRHGRSHNAEEIQKRDRVEKEKLRTDKVLAAATHKIVNETSLDELHSRLKNFLAEINGRSNSID